MADLKEQCVFIRFCFLFGKTAAETVTMFREAFKEESLSQARVYEWFSRFKRGDMSLEDQPRSGCPSTSITDENIKKIRDVIMFDRRRTIDEYIWLMRFECWMTKATNTQSGYVILIAFSRQQYLRKSNPIIRYAHTACLVHHRRGF